MIDMINQHILPSMARAELDDYSPAPLKAAVITIEKVT